jgi:hypothetical protein
MSRGNICFIFGNLFFKKNLKKKIISKKKIAINNKELKEVLNEKYKKVRKLGSGAQGTVYEIEDLQENRKK